MGDTSQAAYNLSLICETGRAAETVWTEYGESLNLDGTETLFRPNGSRIFNRLSYTT